jgi:iron complex transport system substrate-binding protein
MRVVSLLASGTEIVCALGAGDWLVGRSHECDNPGWVRSLPRCSEPAFDISVSSREIDAEVSRRIRSGEPLYVIHDDLIRDLRPDLIIAQEHCRVCAVTPDDVNQNCVPMLSLNARSLNDIFDGIVSVAKALGCEEQGRALVRCEQQRLDNVRARTAGRRRPSVVVLEWIEPVYAMANWGPELVEYAGGALALGHKGEHSYAMASENVPEADPEFLIVAPCGFDLARTIEESSRLREYPWWNKLTGKVALADGNLFFNRSGMTVSRTAEILAEILHGEIFGTPEEGLHWQWMG